MTSWAVYPVRCFLSFKHFFFPTFGWFIVYCQTAWALFVFEPRCDSSISSLSTSHFLQCSSFSFWSIASAEVCRRNRSFIMHQTGKRSKRKSSTMNSKVQPLSKKPFQWHFAMPGPRTRPLFQAAVWFVNVLKVQNLPRFAQSFLQTAQ